MPTVQESLGALEETVADAVELLDTAKTLVVDTNSTTETRIAEAVQVSQNAAISPLYTLTANQLDIQTSFLNYLNS
jgi:hypothetical protein